MTSRRSAGRALAAALFLSALAPAAAAAQEVGRAPAAPAATPAEAARRRANAARAEGARPFFEEHLPAPLLSPGPRGLLWWQWIAIPVLVLLSYLLGSAAGFATRRVLGHLAARTATTWDDLLLQRIARPVNALWAVFFVTALHPWLLLDEPGTALLQHVLRAATYLVLFWAGLRSLEVGFAALATAPWTKGNAGLAGLLPLGRKIAKAVLLAIGVVAVLNELGFQVASLLAGLGIGGIALALAAQKTVENLFGSVAIGVDQPFRVGDFVKVEDVVGTVETIGMRSTRFRTLDRTLVTIANGKLSEMKVETFAARDRLRLYTNLGLSYATTAAQMRAVLAGIEHALLAHPKISTDAPSVRFTELRDSTLNVEVMAWFRTTDWGEFTRVRQELLLEFMRIVEEAGTSLAFPTRTVQLVSEAGAGPRTSPAR
jgi:MscS family membrane protein